MSKLVVISAPSGGGKTTLCERLLRDFAGKLVLSISTTTRAPRGREQNGVEYHFVSKAEFEKGIQDHRFAEWALVHGNYYGTSRTVIEKCFEQGKSVLLDIDVQGAESLRKAYPRECFRIFIAPPSLAHLESRLRHRGTDSEETIQKRLKNARDEMEHAPRFDRIVVNDQLDHAYAELKEVVSHLLTEKNG
ncbi:MAG: guanylate kinase [Bdellovibrionales bacterium GWB1_55_8]|nr:MAG: guanylate kinase [Bdellovibrionales bacterium GWB1_55_8]